MDYLEINNFVNDEDMQRTHANYGHFVPFYVYRLPRTSFLPPPHENFILTTHHRFSLTLLPMASDSPPTSRDLASPAHLPVCNPTSSALSPLAAEFVPSPAAVCRVFYRSGSCKRGDKCPFIHVPGPEPQEKGEETSGPAKNKKPKRVYDRHGATKRGGGSRSGTRGGNEKGPGNLKKPTTDLEEPKVSFDYPGNLATLLTPCRKLPPQRRQPPQVGVAQKPPQRSKQMSRLTKKRAHMYHQRRYILEYLFLKAC